MIERLRIVFRHNLAADGWKCSECHLVRLNGRRPRRGFLLLVAHKLVHHRRLPRHVGTVDTYEDSRGRFRWEFSAPSI